MINSQVRKLLNDEITFICTFDKLSELEDKAQCVDGKIIGTGRSDYTQNSTSYDVLLFNKTFSFIDIPGIEGDESKFENIIKAALDKSHIIFYINGSGKKIEKATLDKIKRYMHDGTSVYAIFNTHCKAKKERIPGIDKTYSEDLNSAYNSQKDIIIQTENELRSFLGNNFKESLTVNGLLAFCSYAIRNGRTTIVKDDNKSLRSDQEKYFKEYNNDIRKMQEESHIYNIQTIINEKISNYDKYIYEENIKKLKSRLTEMHSKIEELNRCETKRIKEFEGLYDEYISNCYEAKEDFISSIRHIGYNSASAAFSDVKAELFSMIENDRGKTDSSKIQQYFNSNKQRIILSIQSEINNTINEAQREYEEAIKDARERLVKDFEREQIKFDVILADSKNDLDLSFANELKYNIKTFGVDLFSVGSLALSGAAIGSLIAPGIGTAIGALVGGIAGLFGRIWNFFASESKRINSAKEKLQKAINEQIDSVANEIKKEIKRLNIEKTITDSYNQIYIKVDKQKQSLNSIKRILDSIELYLSRLNYI